ncbi:delta(14)-sterol reductase LBR [Mixophyes fleayi]|uniref:delta(14)-sterol reductase LBR n=1 Tax=Mixophyes fleayi TaxID=3061075 RepID=UPI003F4D78E8
MPFRRFHDGEVVMGKWPGSSLYYEVQVAKFDSPTQLYTVRYKDGTELELKEGDIRAMFNFRPKKRVSNSPARKRSRSRSRSPARIPASGRTPKRGKQQPSPVVREPLKGGILKVHLTPLKLEDYNIGKRNGDAEGIKKQLEFQEESPYATVEREEELALSSLSQEVKVNEEYIKYEKVLRYNPKKGYIEKENHDDVVKTKPVERNVLEFGGAIGVSCMMLSMPLLLYYVLYTCSLKDAHLLNFYPHIKLSDLWNVTVLGFFVLWIFLHALFYLLPIGKVVQGEPLANGKRLNYRINGFHALVFTIVLISVMFYYKINFFYIYEHVLQFAASATICSVLLSVYVFVRSYRAPQEELSVAGKSGGNFIYTFFMGRELNPHIGDFDLKYFIAVHPGLIGWVFINFTMLLAEMSIQNLDYPSVSMILVNSFQLLYVSHALWNEEGIITSLDIAYDGFGFMLAYGNLVWVPFTYSLQAVYLVRHPVDVSWALAVAIVALNTVGYFIFRSANNEKYSFRKKPGGARLSYLNSIPTSAGSRLLVSGWWGFVRHPNYLGDIIMAWAWCLPCGFAVVLPYFYGFFLTGLLIHRVSRVEHQCKIKYGQDWEKYCQLVPYRVFPYVY